MATDSPFTAPSRFCIAFALKSLINPVDSVGESSLPPLGYYEFECGMREIKTAAHTIHWSPLPFYAKSSSMNDHLAVFVTESVLNESLLLARTLKRSKELAQLHGLKCTCVPL